MNPHFFLICFFFIEKYSKLFRMRLVSEDIAWLEFNFDSASCEVDIARVRSDVKQTFGLCGCNLDFVNFLKVRSH